MLRTICVLFITAGCLGIAVTAWPDSESEKNRILQARAASNEAIRKHDADGIVALFDQTYQITTGSGKLFHDSPEKEKELWAAIFAQFPDVVYVRTPSRIDISTYLPRAAESGNWVGNWTTEKGQIEVGGSYFASWLMVDGRWKIQSETFVSLYCTGDGC
ncbi:MAG: nuclear transport factor 2 family protein, partial [Gammaproteobacteria bacterium]|nr:nuclear transport factor 2 family protein [Gammaproteobacteria bacterium]